MHSTTTVLTIGNSKSGLEKGSGGLGAWLSDLIRDVTVAARCLTKRPTAAIVPILSSAMGISACSLIVGVANVALFRPLPVAEGSGLMSITAQNVKTGEIGTAAAYPDYRDLTAARSFSSVAAYFPMAPAAISTESGEPHRYWGTIASANYFDTVRPSFLLGRGFDPSRDDVPGAPPVVVLSHHLWAAQFASDGGLIGREITMNRRRVTVIGVTSPGFRGTDVAMVSEFWIPLSMRGMLTSALPMDKTDFFADRDAKWLFVLGRLAKGSGREQASAELSAIARRLADSYPGTNRNRSFHVEQAGQLIPAARRGMVVFFILLLTVSGLVLLTACANTANLLLARAAARHKEIATRRAVGAGPGRLIRQLLAESVLLSALGGGLGYVLANEGARYFGTLRLPLSLPIDCSVTFDYRVLLFCTALSFATGLVFGLAPALYAVRQDLVSGLKDRPARLGRSSSWSMRNLLMVGQVAMCMVLLVCSGLFLRTLQSSRYVDTGMEHRNVLLIGFDPFLEHDRADREKLLADILRRARVVPGVESAAITTTAPLSLAGISGSVSLAEGPERTDSLLDSDIYEVSPGFFDTLGIRFVAGEDFRNVAAASDEIILNRAAAERLFPSANPIGRRVRLDGKQTLSVRGVVTTAKSRMMVESPRPCVYKLLRAGMGGGSLTGLTLLARTRGNPAGFVSGLSAAVRAADRGLALFDIRTMERQVNDALLLQRAGAFLFGLAGAMGLVIAATGLYGLVSFVVAGQSKEFGIRMALGARRSQILAGVLGRGMRLTAAGAAAGLLLSVALGRAISSLLYGVSSTDGVTFAAVILFLFFTSAAACIVPAVRAANVAPAISVRGE